MAKKTAPGTTQTPPPAPRECSFCGKPAELSRRLIAGPNDIFICDECVQVCGHILTDETQPYNWLPALYRRQNLGVFLGVQDLALALRANENAPLKILYLAPAEKSSALILKEHIEPLALRYALSVSPLPSVYKKTARPQLQKTIQEIMNSTLLIADLSGKDPGVSFLSGLSYLFTIPMLLMTQDIKDIPPGMAHMRHFIYTPDEAGYAEIKNQLSPVFDFIASDKVLYTRKAPEGQGKPNG
jgi:hypothetical protein